MAQLNRIALAVATLFFYSGCHSAPPTQDPQQCCGGGMVPVSQDQPKTILTHDFGLVEQQQKIQHTFTITNPSEKPIHFQRDPDVGFPCCVELEVTSDVIPPGGSVDVNVYFDTEERPGPFDVFIRLFPNSKDVPAHVHFAGVVRK